jgi:hypothetical protein
MTVKLDFEDYSIEVKDMLQEVANVFLEEAAGEVEAQAKRYSRVDTGQTKRSYTHTVDEANQKAIIGSNSKNAIYEEYGTGEYALNGDGRKTPWVYKNRENEFRTTKGKKANRPLAKAFYKTKHKIERRAKMLFKGASS